jgi:hypothetical protein
MGNEKPIKLDMSFKEVLQMIATGGRMLNSTGAQVAKEPNKSTAQKKQKRRKGAS